MYNFYKYTTSYALLYSIQVKLTDTGEHSVYGG